MATSAETTASGEFGLPSWFRSPAGLRLLEEQRRPVSSSARRFHGDTLLWVGCQTPLMDTVRGCMIRNHFHLAVSGDIEQSVDSSLEDASVPFPTLRGDVMELPLPNNALDALVLHHSLEGAEDPRTALRECARVLTGGGRLLVCGFNPLSLWGARGLYARAVDDAFSKLRFLSPLRLVDWLKVLGFDTEGAHYLAYQLPVNGGGSDARVFRGTRTLLSRYQLPIGGAYVLSAVKRAVAGRPDRSVARLQTGKLAPVAYPKLSAWNRVERSR